MIEGLTYMHEHVSIDLSGIKGDLDCRLDCQLETIKEFMRLFNGGVRNIVELSNIGMGRNLEYIQEVAQASKMNILMSTGFYKEPFLPESVTKKSIDDLAKIMTDELLIGIDGSNIKAELIGEVGTSHYKMTSLEEKVLRAAALAHLNTAAPISTHTTLGTYAQEQIKLFKEIGVDLSKVIIGHVDLTGSFEYIKSLLDSGVTIAFDTIGKENYLSDKIRAELLAQFIAQGYENQIVLSMDITRKSNLSYLGGIGYSYLLDTFVPMLLKKGIPQSSITMMLSKNPQRLLNWRIS